MAGFLRGMFTRAELEQKLKVRNAQLGLRVVVFSVAVIAPFWIAAYMAYKLGFARGLEVAARPGGLALAVVYVVGVLRILRRGMEEHEVSCPKCRGKIRWSLRRVIATGVCPQCRGTVVGR